MVRSGIGTGRHPVTGQVLRKQIRQLKELRAADTEELAQLKADVEALVGALHRARAENSHLRRQLADRHAAIVQPTQAPLGR
ncbi:hypothetical protein [Streptomyces sp. NBC_00057]|uniref:hypothetical protein n=1 Tax=Streptomyces sp. NBC_00057 TaxID=2975634 RepID=UPI00324B5AC3